MTSSRQGNIRGRCGAFVLAFAGLALPLARASAQAIVGNEANPFPGTNLLYTLTWGADDGAACTVVNGPTDNGYNPKLIKNSNCVAAKFLYYENGWVDLFVWNRNAGSPSAAGIAGFGIFWCKGTTAGDPFKCPDGDNPEIGSATTPHNYNDGTAAGNWYSSVSGTDAVDFRIMKDPNGDGVYDASEILVSDIAGGTYTKNILTNGCCGLKGDGWGDNIGIRYLNTDTPFTSLDGNGALRFQFFLGTGANYDFSTQWMVLDVQFNSPPGQGPANSDMYWSCIDDRYTGTATEGPDVAAIPNNTNVGCGGLAVSSVPEPATLGLLATGLLALALVGWRRRKV